MIDLHIHSNFSDGTDSVEEIINKCIENKFQFVSITDHDTIEAIEYLNNNCSVCDKLKNNNIHLINGIEFSGIINGNKVHILGYNFDYKNKALLEVIKLGQKKRINKLEMRINALKDQLNISMSDNIINELRNECHYVGKPIVARYMAKDGIDEYSECIRLLNKLQLPSYETRIDCNIILSAINESNGTSVWAHPLGGEGEKKISIEKVEQILIQLIPLGLGGLECYYNLYTEEEINSLVKLANKYNIGISAGSDYHGINKKVPLGKICLDKDIVVDERQATILSKFKYK